MNSHHIQLVDESQTVLAEAQIVDEGDYFGGTVDLEKTPAPVRLLFEEFEEVVNGQMFAFLDNIQEKIDAIPIKAIFDDGLAISIRDLQVFPSTGDLSFRAKDAPSQVVEPTAPGVEMDSTRPVKSR